MTEEERRNLLEEHFQLITDLEESFRITDEENVKRQHINNRLQEVKKALSKPTKTSKMIEALNGVK